MHIRNACFILAITAATAHAQTPTPKNDATISVGWFGAQYPGLDRYQRWHQSLFSGATGGHYWTDHLKTEVEASWLSHVNVDTYETEDVAGGIAYTRSVYRFQNVKLSLGQIYQFGENAWVHPYLGAGADVDYLRAAEERPAQVVGVFTPGRTASTPISLPKLSERETSVRLHPFVKGGFKMYASDRVFLTTEWKLGFGNGVQHALWKTGFGFDF